MRGRAGDKGLLFLSLEPLAVLGDTVAPEQEVCELQECKSACCVTQYVEGEEVLTSLSLTKKSFSAAASSNYWTTALRVANAQAAREWENIHPARA